MSSLRSFGRRLVGRAAAAPARTLADLSIRPARKNDAGRVVEMAALLSVDEHRPPPAFGIQEFLRDGFGTSPAFRVIVAERSGHRRLVGYALFYAAYDVESASRGLHLADLWVEQPERRNGVGRTLMGALARECRRDGGRFILWQAYDGNADAIAFYDAIGSRRVRSVAFDLGPKEIDKLAREGARTHGL